MGVCEAKVLKLDPHPASFARRPPPYRGGADGSRRSKSMTEHYDALETRDPAAREREEFARMPGVPRVRHDRARLGGASRRVSIRSRSRRAPRWRSCRCCASPSCMRCRRPIRRSAASTSRRPARRSGCTCRPARSSSRRGTARTLAARRARCMRRASVPAISCTMRSPIISRPAPTFWRPVRTRSAARPFPAAIGNTEQQLEAIAHLKPSGYIGTPDFLKILLDAAEKAGKDVSSIKRGLVSGAALPASLRDELRDRGRCGAAMLCCRGNGRHRLRERVAGGHDRQRDADR